MLPAMDTDAALFRRVRNVAVAKHAVERRLSSMHGARCPLQVNFEFFFCFSAREISAAQLYIKPDKYMSNFSTPWLSTW
jgi:hypothetical protein